MQISLRHILREKQRREGTSCRSYFYTFLFLHFFWYIEKNMKENGYAKEFLRRDATV